MEENRNAKRRRVAAAVCTVATSFFWLLSLMSITQHVHLEIFFINHFSEYSKRKSEEAINRSRRVKMKWSEFLAICTPRQFRRKFRMNEECFKELCDVLELSIGGEVFKSER
jgi:hypothetical protein